MSSTIRLKIDRKALERYTDVVLQADDPELAITLDGSKIPALVNTEIEEGVMMTVAQSEVLNDLYTAAVHGGNTALILEIADDGVITIE